MGRKSNHTNPSLGKSLMKKNKPGWDAGTRGVTDRHTREEAAGAGLKSVTEETSYDEFIATAALARKDFAAEKLNIKFVSLATPTIEDLNKTDVTEEDKKLVVVPRRPAWTTTMSAEELDNAEKEVFLEWRRSMAHLQEKEGITPFERNIEVWRQLWRVVEKSNIVIQIVDGRNPLLYRCEDLESYVREMGKVPVLLINKADFLTEKHRQFWSDHFTSIKLSHAFYSAAAAAATSKPIDEEEEDEDTSDSEDDETNEELKVDESKENIPEQVKNSSEMTSESLIENTNEFSPFGIKILNREQLIEFLRTFKKSTANQKEATTTDEVDTEKLFNVGLVGYPNVGKSSTINSLMDCKKTSVSSTPGKTKHFQTLFLENDILLCDCPGLVMPAFGGSKGAMLLGGILPIDQLTNYAPSMALLRDQIPRRTLESKYGITLPPEYNFEEVLASYASIRGFMTARGLPDSSRASRIILKDYVEGRLIYCHPPPNVSHEEFQPTPKYDKLRLWTNTQSSQSANTPDDQPEPESTKKTTLKKVNVEKVLDKQFFSPVQHAAHIKGKQYIPSGLSSSSSSSSTGSTDKPWKKHNNKNKGEKLRRLYRHLDVE